jgi:hypothetical protein
MNKLPFFFINEQKKSAFQTVRTTSFVRDKFIKTHNYFVYNLTKNKNQELFKKMA